MSTNLVRSLSIREGVKLDNECCCTMKISDDIINKVRSSVKYQNVSSEYQEEEEDITETFNTLNIFSR